MRDSIVVFVAAACILCLQGCSANSANGGRAAGGLSRAIRGQLNWPERSRAITAPSSAQSAVFILRGGSANGGDATLPVVNRRVEPAAYSQTVTSGNEMKVGTFLLIVNFFAQPDGKGDIVGVAQAMVTVQDSDTPTDIGDITMNQTVASVEVPKDASGNDQSVGVGQSKDLVFTAKDSSGKILALSPGSGFWSVSAADQAKLQLTRGGQATGIAEGSAAVTVTVDGVASAPANIAVNPTNATPRFAIAWDARSRATNAPSSALSAVAVLKDANPPGGDAAFLINRKPDPAGYTDNLTWPAPIKAGTRQMTVNFFAQPDGKGDLVGVAQAIVTISPDGSGIGDIATNRIVASVAVPAGQVLLIGQTKDLVFTALNAQGRIVAVTPGSAFWQADTSGKLRITAGGQATGVAAGAASVTATVDGKPSTPATVTVTSGTGGVAVGIN